MYIEQYMKDKFLRDMLKKEDEMEENLLHRERKKHDETCSPPLSAEQDGRPSRDCLPTRLREDL